MILDLRHHLGDAAFELRIVTGNLGFGIVVDFNVRIDAMAFDDPFAILVREG